MTGADGLRDLALVRSSGSTARVLNLALVFERHGQTEEYAKRPMFKHPRLNRALILKHALRKGEKSRFTRPVTTATKIILPYSPTELRLGGVSLMVGEQNFEALLSQAIGGEDKAALAADLAQLQLLDTLPSFDPFLMRERLRAMGVEPARCYFDLSEADIERMRTFVGGEIALLVNRAFGAGKSTSDVARRLADKLMTDETAKSLDPLRETLHLSEQDYAEGVFAWKGFLYYKWLMAEFAPQLAAFRPHFASCRILGVDSAERQEFAMRRKELLARIEAVVARIDATLLEYDQAFAGLTGADPAQFRSFLFRAPGMFLALGEAVGVIKHIHSYWTYRFPQNTPAMLEADEAAELLHDYDLALSDIAYSQQQPAAISA